MSSDFSESDTTFHLLIKKLIPSINTNINNNDFFIIGLRNVLIQPFVLLTNVSNIYNSTVYQNIDHYITTYGATFVSFLSKNEKKFLRYLLVFKNTI